MSWVKLDDRFPEHRKVEDLSDAAFRLHVTALCWTASKEKDGMVPRKAARKMGTPTRISELLDAGLWVELEDGEYEIHDYLDYNPSHDQLEAKRAAARARMQAARSDVGDADCSGVTEDVTDDVTEGVSDGAGYAPESPAPLPLNLSDRNRDQNGSARNGAEPDQPTRLGSGRPRRWRRVPADWAPNQVHFDLAVRLNVSLATETDSFRDHEFKDPKTDADACFRTWLRNAARFGRVLGYGQRSQSSATGLVARAKRIAEEERRKAGGDP